MQLALVQQLLQAGHEFAAEKLAHDVNGREKVARGRYPLALVVCETAAGDDAMDMRMKHTCLVQVCSTAVMPTARLCQASWVGGQAQERVGGKSEKESKDRGAVVVGKAVQLTGQREDEVEIVNG